MDWYEPVYAVFTKALHTHIKDRGRTRTYEELKSQGGSVMDPWEQQNMANTTQNKCCCLCKKQRKKDRLEKMKIFLSWKKKSNKDNMAAIEEEEDPCGEDCVRLNSVHSSDDHMDCKDSVESTDNVSARSDDYGEGIKRSSDAGDVISQVVQAVRSYQMLDKQEH